MSLRTSLAVGFVGVVVAAILPMSAASANDGDCLPQVEPPPECSYPGDPPPPPEPVPELPAPPGMTPVSNMEMMPNLPIPSTPLAGRPGEVCSSFGFDSRVFSWIDAWRVRLQYTFRVQGRACVRNGVIVDPVMFSSTLLAGPRDPRLKSVSVPSRQIVRSGAKTPEFVGIDEVFAVFCGDPIFVNTCETYRHRFAIKVVPGTATGQAELVVVPGSPPSI